jgi:hypothetical protein
MSVQGDPGLLGVFSTLLKRKPAQTCLEGGVGASPTTTLKKDVQPVGNPTVFARLLEQTARSARKVPGAGKPGSSRGRDFARFACYTQQEFIEALGE